MAERFKAPVLKTGVGATSPWVRIPLPPPDASSNPFSVTRYSANLLLFPRDIGQGLFTSLSSEAEFLFSAAPHSPKLATGPIW